VAPQRAAWHRMPMAMAWAMPSAYQWTSQLQLKWVGETFVAYAIWFIFEQLLHARYANL